MNKISLLTFIFILSLSLSSQDKDMLLAKHKQYAQNEAFDFINASHYYFTEKIKGADIYDTYQASVFISGSDFSCYKQNNDAKKIYTYGKLLIKNKQLHITIKHIWGRFDQNTLKYTIICSFDGMSVMLDKHVTNITLPKSWNLLALYLKERDVFLLCSEKGFQYSYFLKAIAAISHISNVFYEEAKNPQRGGWKKLKKTWSLNQQRKFLHVKFDKRINILKHTHSIKYYTNNVLVTKLRRIKVNPYTIKIYYESVLTTGGPFSLSGEIIVKYK